MSLRIGSLCTGYGGLDMAVMDVLDARTAWHCQYDPDDRHQYAARILEHHWPDVPNHGDITRVDWATVEPIDILTAGFPCQDLSYAGRGAGIKEGTRSGLWYAVADAIRALRPRLVFLENVRAIVARRPGLDVVLASLADLGFDAEWTTVRASDVGAPHQRERWFCLAWPADASGSRLEGRRVRRTVAECGRAAAHADSLGSQRDGSLGQPPERHTARANRTVAHAYGHTACHDGELPARRNAVQQRIRNDAAGRCAAPADSDRDAVRQQPVAESGNGGEAVAGRAGVEWGAYGPAVARWEHALGRPAPAPVDDRGRLAAPFVEWMMGLPPGHVTGVPASPGMRPAGLRNARLKALGNGVVRQQAAHALRLLLDRAGQEVTA